MSKYKNYLSNHEIKDLPYLFFNDFEYIDSSLESLFDSLSSMLETLYNKITFAGDLINKFSTVDFIYQKTLNEQYINFLSFYNSLTSQEKKQTVQTFIYTVEEKAPILQKYISIMKSYTIIVSDILNMIKDSLNTTIVTNIPSLLDLFNKSNLAQYKNIGISINETDIVFDSPFSKFPIGTELKELGYTSLDDIRTINETYKYNVQISLTKLLRIKNQLVNQYAQLKTELNNNQNDTDSIKMHFKYVLFVTNVVCNLTSKMLSLNRFIMYKNKLILDIGIKIVLSIINERD